MITRKLAWRQRESRRNEDHEKEFLARHEVTRNMIEHENFLIGIRIGWMIACQGLLITALGLGDFDLVPKLAVAILGMAISIFSRMNVIYAQIAIKDLKLNWARFTKDRNSDFPSVIGFSNDDDSEVAEIETPPVMIANAFIAFWLLLAIYYCISFAHCAELLIVSDRVLQCEAPAQKMIMTWPTQ